MFEVRFTLILTLLQRTMGNHVARPDLHGPLLIQVWNRLTRMFRRFERLVVLWRAGTLPVPPAPRVRAPRAAAAAKPRLPRGRFWLLRLTGLPAATAASQLRHLMTDEELGRFLAEVPQAGRVLRPLCQMLGMSRDEVELRPIRLPDRPRKPRPPKPPRPESRTAMRRRWRGMTGAELAAELGPLPPHFNLPIPGYQAIRRKIRAYLAAGDVRA